MFISLFVHKYEELEKIIDIALEELKEKTESMGISGESMVEIINKITA